MDKEIRPEWLTTKRYGLRVSNPNQRWIINSRDCPGLGYRLFFPSHLPFLFLFCVRIFYCFVVGGGRKWPEIAVLAVLGSMTGTVYLSCLVAMCRGSRGDTVYVVSEDGKFKGIWGRQMLSIQWCILCITNDYSGIQKTMQNFIKLFSSTIFLSIFSKDLVGHQSQEVGLGEYCLVRWFC